MVLDGVVEPLLAVGEAVAPLIDGDQRAVGQVIQQGGRLAPGQTHQPPHPLRRSALQQLFAGLGAEQLIETLGHALAQGIGN